MPQENLELTRRSFEAVDRRDQEAFLALMDPEVEVHSRFAAVEGAYRGHEGVRRWWRDFLGTFSEYAIEVKELRDLGEVVVVHFAAKAEAAASGASLIDDVWMATRWRDGRCVWWQVCGSEEEALEAAGIERRP